MTNREARLILFSIVAIFSACLFVGIYGHAGIPTPVINDINTISSPAPIASIVPTPTPTVSIMPTPTKSISTPTPIITPTRTPTPGKTKIAPANPIPGPNVTPTPSITKATPKVTHTPMALPTAKPTGNSTDILMQKDLLNIVGFGVLPALSTWKYEPPVDTPISFDPGKSTWSISDNSKVIYSGKTYPGNMFSGIIKTDGSFCVQVQNTKGSSAWLLNSTTGELTKGTCP